MSAKKLGGAINKFTRVDLYATNRGVVFGEFTPTPYGGADLLNGPINGLEACGKALKVLKISRREVGC